MSCTRRRAVSRSTAGDREASGHDRRLRRYAHPRRDRDFEMRAVANPRAGDQLIVDGETFVQGEPERRDPDRLVWSLDMRPA
jgi:hypothetical protein